MGDSFASPDKFAKGDVSPIDGRGYFPLTSKPMMLPDFISRCDRYCEAAGVSRTWLSKRLFSDTNRISDLATGGSDVGVRRLERASRDLDALESDLAEKGAAA